MKREPITKFGVTRRRIILTALAVTIPLIVVLIQLLIMKI